MLESWRKILVSQEDTIKHTIKVIEENASQIALVVDSELRLLGTVTDGDVRRGVLKGIQLDESISKVMNLDPTISTYMDNKDSILRKMKSKKLHHIPIIDEEGRVIGLEVLDELIRPVQRDNIVVLMAGGLGTRLRPLTENCPKPLLNVGNKPILETIIENFAEYGFTKFYLSVNYKYEMIKEYFGDGSNWGVQIDYIQENKMLGTAGSLSLLPEKPSIPIIVMNGDLLTKVNFKLLLDYHIEHKSQATMCVREYDYQIPYGVVKVDKQHRLLSIEEKPIHRYFVNAGIYVLSPIVLQYLSEDSYHDMPTLFEKVIEDNCCTSVYPIREYWCDIGRIGDYEKANSDYEKVFL